MEATAKFWGEQAELWARITRRALGDDVEPMIAPERGDKRWKDELWEKSPFFAYLQQSYLLTGRWLKQRLDEAEGLEPRERQKLALC